ncbi:MAG: DeoR/GlpR family DNA-binding transcription regulator [Spirochaetaceae bacterium]|jgi:DeoR/GlpR family transcriptional regulator of sugar metabolism|nr:DeoR/GlpR family DNA-binding transcription regulator [Spirochaetaceae bacterium]
MNERQQGILEILNDHGFASVTGLSDHFEVSEMTIRRDLQLLEESKVARRVHGGVVSAAGFGEEPVFDERAANRVEEKRIIAGLAAALVADNSVIALDTGSSALALVRFLTAKNNLTIITTSIPIMQVCLNHENLKVIVPGGVLRPYEGSLVGTSTVEFLGACHVDQFFMGVGGIDLSAGVTEYSMDDIAVKRVLVANAAQVIVLADSSKFGRVTFGRICSLDKLDMIVTNNRIPADFKQDFDRLGIPVLCP